MTSVSNYSKRFADEIFEVNWLIWILVTIFSFGVFLLVDIGVFDPVINAMEAPTIKLRGDIYDASTATSGLLAGFGNLPEIIQENKDLQAKNLELESKMAQIDVIFNQNQDLINETGIDYDRDYEQVGVKVIGRESADPGVVVINKGSGDGVDVGDTAVIEDILLGEVTSVDESTSKVRFIINANAKLPVKNSKESVGLLKGVSGRELLIEQILQSKEVVEGDKIFSSGLEGNFPPDLYIGEIGNVNVDDRSSTKSAELVSPVDWNNIPRFKILLDS